MIVQMRPSPVVAAAVMVLLLAGCSDSSRDLPPSVQLLADFTADSVYVRAISEADRRRPIRGLRPPRITPANFSTFPPGASEYVVHIHDAEGEILDSYGYDGTATGFLDRHDEAGVLMGRPPPATLDTRLLRLPIPENAHVISFSRFEVFRRRPGRPPRPRYDHVFPPGPGSRVALGVKHIGSQGIPSREGLLPDPPERLRFSGIPDIDDVVRLLREYREWSKRFGWQGRREPVIIPTSLDAHIYETIYSSGDPKDRFNIVFLGDGFTEDEAADYQGWVGPIVETMMGTEPFKSKIDQINIYLVTTKSIESGITNCSDYVAGIADTATAPTDDSFVRDTYFGLYGWAEDENADQTYHGYIAVPDYELIYEAVDRIIDSDEVDLFVMIANCPAYGGAAYPDAKLAIVTLPWAGASTDLFVDVAFHEMGHVIAGLGEEYISCRFGYEYKSYPNIVHEFELDDVWWKVLAEPDEIDASTGKFKAIYECADGAGPGDPDCPKEQNDQSVLLTDYPLLGLYWGAQFIDVDPTTFECVGSNGNLTFDQFTSPLGRHYYRPQSQCRMRQERWEFCRACSDTISSVIDEASLLSVP